jgi:hypothetical protein
MHVQTKMTCFEVHRNLQKLQVATRNGAVPSFTVYASLGRYVPDAGYKSTNFYQATGTLLTIHEWQDKVYESTRVNIHYHTLNCGCPMEELNDIRQSFINSRMK